MSFPRNVKKVVFLLTLTLLSASNLALAEDEGAAPKRSMSDQEMRVFVSGLDEEHLLRLSAKIDFALDEMTAPEPLSESEAAVLE